VNSRNEVSVVSLHVSFVSILVFFYGFTQAFFPTLLLRFILRAILRRLSFKEFSISVFTSRIGLSEDNNRKLQNEKIYALIDYNICSNI